MGPPGRLSTWIADCRVLQCCHEQVDDPLECLSLRGRFLGILQGSVFSIFSLGQCDPL